MKQIFNFSAGPSVLPHEALLKAQEELLNYNNSGMSVMEMSHRSKVFDKIHNDTISLLKELMNISDDYEVLLLQGGASLQFAMVPMNFASKGNVYYIEGGTWGDKAFKEAKMLVGDRAILLASSKDDRYCKLPTIPTIPGDATYLHITTNNTVEGTCLFDIPKTKVPIIADMSSNILSVNYDINDFDLVYAGAQKNLGPSGVVVVIVKKALLNTIEGSIPTMLDYRTHVKSNSLYNTPPTFGIYMLGNVLQWVKDKGGIEAMTQAAKEKSDLLYKTLDESSLFDTAVKGKDRSVNNIPFFTASDDLNKLFLSEAEAQGLVNLKGHRLVGGMRASIYNAMPMAGVIALCNFIKDFEKKYGGQ